MNDLIIGVGDPFFSDDAIGLILLKQLRERRIPDHTVWLETGKRSFQIIDHLKVYKRILILDAAKMGLQPGEWRIFQFQDVRTRMAEKPLSFHEFGVAENLLLAQSLGYDLGHVSLFGIQPKSTDPGESLTPEISAHIPEYVQGIEVFFK